MRKLAKDGRRIVVGDWRCVCVCGKRICRKGGGEGEREGARAVAASK